jgi:hypothetical protein
MLLPESNNMYEGVPAISTCADRQAMSYTVANTVLFHSIRQSRDFRLPPENPINREKIIAGVKKNSV